MLSEVATWKCRNGIFVCGFYLGRISSFHTRSASVEWAGQDVTHSCSGHPSCSSISFRTLSFHTSEHSFCLLFSQAALISQPCPVPDPGLGWIWGPFLELRVHLPRWHSFFVLYWLSSSSLPTCGCTHCSRTWPCYKSCLESSFPSWLLSSCVLWCFW